MDAEWECVVVGGGAAGLSAALVLARARRRVLVVDAGEQSNRGAEGIGGLLGHDRRSPRDLYRLGRAELTAYDRAVFRSGRVVSAVDAGSTFEVALEDGSQEASRTLLLATGMQHVLPDLPGLAERWGHSVFHCPFCHGWEVRERPVGVLDRSERAVERALLLRFWSDDVTLYTDGALELAPSAWARLEGADVALEDRTVTGVRGRDRLLAAIDLADGADRVCEGLLVPTPLVQRSPLATQLGARATSADGSLEVDGSGRTSIRGVYAAGDVGAHALPSVATAIATGSTAAKTIVQDLVAATFPLRPLVAAEAGRR